jgi:hypothetical protein
LNAGGTVSVTRSSFDDGVTSPKFLRFERRPDARVALGGPVFSKKVAANNLAQMASRQL